MCGIAGIINKNKQALDPQGLFLMAETLAHRGPDDEKFILFDTERCQEHLFTKGESHRFQGNVGFAHRRLSIIDLSEKAAQPLCDEERKRWIIHNGEIFNYLEIRDELIKLGHAFQTQSDTEVILKSYKQWGEECLHRFNGMWAFVIYDTENRKIFGARDRFGIKPFFYHENSLHFSFASEVKALLTLPWIDRKPFMPVIKDYLLYSRVDTSKYSFFEGTQKLDPGSYLTIDLRDDFNLKTVRWWKIQEHIQHDSLEESQRYDKFREVLLSSVKLRLRSDVPIGTCLSGGIDSSAVVSLANPYLGEGKQRTFSIIQPGFKYDESRYMDEIITRFNVIPKKIVVKGDDLLKDLDEVIHSHDEPFTSTSMYAQWKVFELAKKNGVTVTLDGQGADESMAGYPYFRMVYWAELLERGKFRRYLEETCSNTQRRTEFLVNLLSSFTGFFPHRKMISWAKIRSPQYSSSWIEKTYLKNIPLPSAEREKEFDHRLNQRLYEIFAFDGLPALLRYADRNSMAHSLESRMPFLDHRLVTFLFSLSSEFKIRNGWSKHIMREALKDDVPQAVMMRRDKIGFVTQESDWFRTDMSEFIRGIIQSSSLKKRGFFHVESLGRMFEKHASGRIDASRPLWRAVNLELWCRRYID
jgi:asparagine synthase (glutamine-hydrolysing)